MRQELKERILAEFPKLMNENINIYCGDGWYELLRELLIKIAHMPDLPEDYKVVRVKQKYGGMDVWGLPYHDPVADLYYEYEQKSFEVCERCGATDNVSWLVHDGWEQVACYPCSEMIKGGWEEGCAEFSTAEKDITKEIRNLMHMRLKFLLEEKFPGGSANMVLDTEGISHLTIKDAEGRIFAC